MLISNRCQICELVQTADDTLIEWLNKYEIQRRTSKVTFIGGKGVKRVGT